MNAAKTAGICLVLGGVTNRERNLLVALCTAALLCSLSPALDLGLMVGSDGVTLAAPNDQCLYSETQPNGLPLGAAALCDLHSGGRFVLRAKAGYGVLQHKESTARPDGYDEHSRAGLHAVRVQAAPCVLADVPGMPFYLQAGLGCGAHLSWTQGTYYNGDLLMKAAARGLDATGLLAVGVRVNPRLSLELGLERLLADWSVTTRQYYSWEDSSRLWEEVSHSNSTTLNLSSVIEPGYAVGIVWTP